MDNSVCPDSLEKIFLKVEQESERRAHLSHHKTAEAIQEVGIVSESGKRHKDHRRGSVSFSLVGQVTEDNSISGACIPPTGPASSSQSASVYGTQAKNESIDSIGSGAASASSNDDGDVEDSMHVTRMHHIAGRPSISSKIHSRLSWSHSASMIPTMGTEAHLMIGVSVEEATSESTSEDGMEMKSRRSSIQAGRLPHRSPKSSTPGSSLLPTKWISKITHIFRSKLT